MFWVVIWNTPSCPSRAATVTVIGNTVLCCHSHRFQVLKSQCHNPVCFEKTGNNFLGNFLFSSPLSFMSLKSFWKFQNNVVTAMIAGLEPSPPSEASSCPNITHGYEGPTDIQ